MSIRREPTYLSREVWRSCWLLAKARTPKDESERFTTADEMADETFDHHQDKYPQLLNTKRQSTDLKRNSENPGQ